MVARMRRMAEQTRVLHRAAALDSYFRCVSFVRGYALIPSSESPNVCGMVGAQKLQRVQGEGLALLILDNAYSAASSILSVTTNVLATSLIAYKAWCVVLVSFSDIDFDNLFEPTLNREHRQLVKKHFATVETKSRVLQALALLIESGSIYSVFIVSLSSTLAVLTPALLTI